MKIICKLIGLLVPMFAIGQLVQAQVAVSGANDLSNGNYSTVS